MSRTIGLPELVLFLAIVFVFFSFWPWARVFSKAGYSPWWCLTVYIPIVNLIVLFWFAFDWPVLQRLRHTPGTPIR
jgi:hypothetical protein